MANLILGILVRDNTFPSYLIKLNKLQNKAFRIGTGENWNNSANPLYRKLNTVDYTIGFTFELRNIKICLPTR